MHEHRNERTFRPEAAARLENPERLEWLPPGQVVAALQLRDSMTVADIGAGTGYFAIPIARELTNGHVFAVDFQREMLYMLAEKLASADAPSNISLVEAEARTTQLGDGRCDRVLIANVWHELDERHVVLDEMKRVLAPEGELFILDWRDDVDSPPGPPPEHRLSPQSVIAELEKAAWRNVSHRHVGRFSFIVQAMRPA